MALYRVHAVAAMVEVSTDNENVNLLAV